MHHLHKTVILKTQSFSRLIQPLYFIIMKQKKNSWISYPGTEQYNFLILYSAKEANYDKITCSSSTLELTRYRLPLITADVLSDNLTQNVNYTNLLLGFIYHINFKLAIYFVFFTFPPMQHNSLFRTLSPDSAFEIYLTLNTFVSWSVTVHVV